MKISKLLYCLVGIIGGVIFISLCVSSMLSDSAIWDEPTHLGSGYIILKTGEDKLNPEHPRLFKQISAIPLILLKLKIPFSPDFDKKVNPVEFGKDFLYNQTVDADKILFLARFPSILIALLLMFFIFKFVKYLYGELIALFALGFFIFDPNIIAHSRYVTNDIYITCFFFISIYQLKRFVDKPKISRLILLSIFSGLTLISKFSGLILIPIILLILFIEIFIRKNEKVLNLFSKKHNENEIDRISNTHTNPSVETQYITSLQWGLMLKSFFIVLIILFLICGLIIFADYNFEFTTFEKAIDYKLKSTETKIDDYLVNKESVLFKPMKFFVTKIPIPAPTYLYGALWHFQYSAKGHPSFLMGHFSKKGFRNYFPIAFLIKTPIVLLFFLTIGILLFIKNIKRDLWNEYILILPPLIYFGTAIFDIFNIGYRHILPIIPFCIVIATNSTVLLFKKARTIAFISIVLLLYYIFGTISIHPYYLSYFNESIGGAKNGYKYLVDSNIDWGQDLKRLSEYLKKNQIDEITLSYFGKANANYYDIKFKPLLIYLLPGSSKEEINPEANTPGWYAISVTNLQGAYYNNHNILDWLKRREPIAKIGYSIHIYKVEKEYTPVPELNKL